MTGTVYDRVGKSGLWAVGGILGALAVGAPALAQDSLPAVSETNYKLNVAGGALDPLTVYFAEGSVTTPITHSIGLQIDGLGGLHDGDGMGGGAAHLFWRDPAIGMVGLYGSGFANTVGLNYSVGNVGIEGALYFGQFTLEGMVGAQFVNRLDTDIFGVASLAFYPIDDLRLHGGYRYWFGQHIGMAGFEWQLPGQNDNSVNWGLFADAQFREDSMGAWGGVRIYFGSQKPLIRRHREDDPFPFMPFDINAFLAPAAGINCNDYFPEYPMYPTNVATTAVSDFPSEIPAECRPRSEDVRQKPAG